ncbi:MAG TPA: hypothetical protein VMT29_19145 [Steroidobacteraceae bacterium]|nr:hypothetical protein [Steroidobacteraceae bacterium]
MNYRAIGLAMIALLTGSAAAADGHDATLKEGRDADLTTARCSICHSTDYIPMNSVFLKQAGWDAEVHKMIKVMGAPIPEDEAQKIIAYLTQYYGVAQ